MSINKIAPFTSGDELGLYNELNQLDNKSFERRILKMTEELGELSEAFLDYMEGGYKNKTKEDIIEEAVDVLIMAKSILAETLENSDEIASSIDLYEKKLNKWANSINQNQISEE